MSDDYSDDPETPDATPGKRKKSLQRVTRGSEVVSRDYSVSMTEAVRKRVDPNVLIDFNIMILMGINPVLRKDARSKTGWKCIPDPSPSATSPTLEQKNAASKYLTERGWGMPTQSLQVEADIRSRIEGFGSGIDSRILENVGADKLMQLAKLLELPPGDGPPAVVESSVVKDAIDADFTEIKSPSTTDSAIKEPVPESSES